MDVIVFRRNVIGGKLKFNQETFSIFNTVFIKCRPPGYNYCQFKTSGRAEMHLIPVLLAKHGPLHLLLFSHQLGTLEE